VRGLSGDWQSYRNFRFEGLSRSVPVGRNTQHVVKVQLL